MTLASLTPTLATAAPAADDATIALPGLEWHAPAPACADRRQIAEDVANLLGTAPADRATSSKYRIAVEIGEAQPGWVARITLFDSAGSSLGVRELRSRERSCHSLDGPVALVTALMIESTRREPTPIELPPAPVPAVPEQVPASDWRAEWRATVVGSGGLLPGFALGALLGVGATPPGFVPIVLDVAIWPGAERTVDGRGGAFSAWHAGLAICPPLASNEWGGVGVCLGAEGGVLSATGVGLDTNSSPRQPLVAGRADLRAWVALGGPFIAHLQAGALVPFLRPNYLYDGPDGQPVEVHRPWPVVPVGALGLGFVLPP